MIKITYWRLFSFNLLSFIDYLKKYYKNIYFDTGLVDENQIIHWYIDRADNLYNEILSKIEITINSWYFWNIYEKTDNYVKSKLVLKVKSYTIVLDVYKSWNIVLIEDIFIN